MSETAVQLSSVFAISTSTPRRRTGTTSGQQAGVGERSGLAGADVIIANPPYLQGRGPSPATTAPLMHTMLQRDHLLAPTYRAGPTITRVPDFPTADYRFELLQQWEGVVQELGSGEFTAVLRDLTNTTGPEEEVVLAIDEVTPDDLELLAPGGIFYWSIGYRKARTGQVDRVSTIRFRRLPAWSHRDLQRLDQRTKALMERFGALDAAAGNG